MASKDKTEIDFILDAVRRQVRVTPDQCDAIRNDYNERKVQAERKAIEEDFFQVLASSINVTFRGPQKQHRVTRAITGWNDLADADRSFKLRTALLQDVTEAVGSSELFEYSSHIVYTGDRPSSVVLLLTLSDESFRRDLSGHLLRDVSGHLLNRD